MQANESPFLCKVLDAADRIGSIAESCEGDEQKPTRIAEAACTMCEGEAVETGEMHFVCADCRDKLASYDLEHHNLRMTAKRSFELFRHMDALDVPEVLIEAQAKLIEQHLIDYIPKTLITKQAVETEIALWRARTAARKAG